MLAFWWGEYEFPYILFVATPLVWFYYVGLYLRCDSDNILRIAAWAISEFANLTDIQFLLYAAEEAAPDCFVESLRFDNVESGMFFRLPTSI